jgi:site-specific DNA recombinase
MAPYGYRYTKINGEHEGYYVVYEPEAEIVQMIFKWVVDDGFSVYRIVEELFQHKIPPPNNKRPYWGKSTINRLLKRKDYIGKSYYNKTISTIPKNPSTMTRYRHYKKSSRMIKPKEEWIEIPVPQIVEENLYYRAQERLKENILCSKRNKKYDYLLSGLIYCNCGSRRVGDGIRHHHYYRCSQRINKFPLHSECQSEGVNAVILDEMVWNRILTLFSNKDLVKQQIERWIKNQDKHSQLNNNETTKINTTIEKLCNEEKRYTIAYGENLIPLDQLKRYLNDIKLKKIVLESQLKAAKEQSQGQIGLGDNIDDACINTFYNLKYASGSDKQDYLRKLKVRISVGKRNYALLEGHIPLEVQAHCIQDETKYRYSRSSKRRKINSF